jgi:polyisoprenoid-binding protein YceI
MHGVTKPLTLKLTRLGSGPDPWGNTRTGFDTTFVVKRSEFGVSFMPQGLSEEVTVMISVEGIKKK